MVPVVEDRVGVANHELVLLFEQADGAVDVAGQPVVQAGRFDRQVAEQVHKLRRLFQTTQSTVKGNRVDLTSASKKWNL